MFRIALVLVPAVCNAGILTPAHAADEQMGHHGGAGHQAAAVRLAAASPSCDPHHGHACCIVAARKTLREDVLECRLGVVCDAPGSGGAAESTSTGAPLPPPRELPGPCALAAVNVPLLR